MIEKGFNGAYHSSNPKNSVPTNSEKYFCESVDMPRGVNDTNSRLTRPAKALDHKKCLKTFKRSKSQSEYSDILRLSVHSKQNGESSSLHKELFKKPSPRLKKPFN